MALGLKRLFGAAPSRGRLAAWVGVVVGVVIVHAFVTRAVLAGMDDKIDEDAMPPRIEVAYVREMTLAEPPPMAAPAAPPPAAPSALAVHKPRPKVPKPVKAASAPEAKTDAAEKLAAAAAASAASAASAAAAADDVTVAMANAQQRAASEVQASSSAASEASSAAADGASAASAGATGASSAMASATNAASSPASSAVANAASPAASGALANFEWPTSTRISYQLTGYYRGPMSGSGQVEWIRDGSHYQVHVDLVLGPSSAPLVTRRMSSDGEITAEGLAPRRYDQQTKVLMRSPQHVTMSFEPGSVILGNGDRRDSVPGVQDTASQFVQLTYVFGTRPDLLKVGGTVDIPLALPHKVDVWTYDVVGEEVLNAPWGPLPTVHLKPQRKNVSPGSLTAEIWFAPQLRYLPVRILIHQDEDNYADMMVDRPPELGSP